jgi:hypothetical protein
MKQNSLINRNGPEGRSSLASLAELLTPRLTIYQLPLVFEEGKRNSTIIDFRKDEVTMTPTKHRREVRDAH